jgi:hypothetical protein
MNSSRGDRAPKPCLHLAQHCASVGIVIEPENRQQHGLFEGAEGVCHRV